MEKRKVLYWAVWFNDRHFSQLCYCSCSFHHIRGLMMKTPQEALILPALGLSISGLLASTSPVLRSGIISLIGCGLIQAHYAFKNISPESLTTVNYFIKMLSSTRYSNLLPKPLLDYLLFLPLPPQPLLQPTSSPSIPFLLSLLHSDCIIFLYLGMAFFESHDWNTGFVGWTLLLCLVVRFVTFISSVVRILPVLATGRLLSPTDLPTSTPRPLYLPPISPPPPSGPSAGS